MSHGLKSLWLKTKAQENACLLLMTFVLFQNIEIQTESELLLSWKSTCVGGKEDSLKWPHVPSLPESTALCTGLATDASKQQCGYGPRKGRVQVGPQKASDTLLIVKPWKGDTAIPVCVTQIPGSSAWRGAVASHLLRLKASILRRPLEAPHPHQSSDLSYPLYVPVASPYASELWFVAIRHIQPQDICTRFFFCPLPPGWTQSLIPCLPEVFIPASASK